MIISVVAAKIWYLKNVRFLLGHPVYMHIIYKHHDRQAFYLAVSHVELAVRSSHPACRPQLISGKTRHGLSVKRYECFIYARQHCVTNVIWCL